MSHPTRLRSFSYLGHQRYFVTTCTYQRQSVFRDAAIVTMVGGEILQSGKLALFEILAYCFMPDHLHLLVTGETADAEFPSFVKLAKQRSGWRYTRNTGHRLWQTGYHERVLRDEEATAEVIRYIIANPVRGGLVVRPCDYPFWGSATYSREEILAFVSEHRRA